MRLPIACFFLWLLIPTQHLEAQFSWKPRPLPEARTFLVTEIGYAYRINDYAEGAFNLERHHYFTSEVGAMVNTSESFAVGATSFTGMDEGGNFRWAVKTRFRWWLDRERSIELSQGLILWDSRGAMEGFGLMSSATVNVTRWIALVGQVEVVPTDRPGGTDLSLYLGGRVGSTPGLVGNVAAAVLALLGGAAYMFSGGE